MLKTLLKHFKNRWTCKGLAQCNITMKFLYSYKWDWHYDSANTVIYYKLSMRYKFNNKHPRALSGVNNIFLGTIFVSDLNFVGLSLYHINCTYSICTSSSFRVWHSSTCVWNLECFPMTCGIKRNQYRQDGNFSHLSKSISCFSTFSNFWVWFNKNFLHFKTCYENSKITSIRGFSWM